MNISTTQAGGGSSLLGLPGFSEVPASSPVSAQSQTGPAWGAPETLFSGAQAASAALQTTASYVEAASGYSELASGILSQMSALAGEAQAPSGADAGVASQFEALQQALRGMIGGSTGEIGGAAAVSPAGASFDGCDIFGPSGASPASSSLPSGFSDSTGALNLRQGAILGLVTQDESGAFTVRAGDPGAPAAVSAALGQVSSAAGALARAQSAINWSVSAEGSARTPASAADVQASTQIAAISIAAQPAAALAAQTGRTLLFGYGLLQEG